MRLVVRVQLLWFQVVENYTLNVRLGVRCVGEMFA
jgi:hypothetical protein